MLKTVLEFLLNTLFVILAGCSLIMIFVLLRFGKSKILGALLSLFYILLMISLYAAAVKNFEQIPFASL